MIKLNAAFPAKASDTEKPERIGQGQLLQHSSAGCRQEKWSFVSADLG